jgi:RNA polymerase sigma-70 factor (ECF subfamily)
MPATPSSSFSAEIMRLLEPLYADAMRLTRNRADAEDLLQDTLVKALRFEERFTPGTNLKAWLFTILHNTWKNNLRGAAREPVDVDSDRVAEASDGLGASSAETPERMLLRESLDVDLQAALDALPGAYREAVWLRDVEEFTYAEIAEMLDVPIGTVMSRISRGRRMMLERLNRRADALRLPKEGEATHGS